MNTSNSNRYTGLSSVGDLMEMPGEASAAPLTMEEVKALALANHAIATGTIGARIKDLRGRAGLSQQALSDACGVSKAAVSNWEADVTDNMGLQPFLKLLVALHTNFEYLAFGRGLPPRPTIQNKRRRHTP